MKSYRGIQARIIAFIYFVMVSYLVQGRFVNAGSGKRV